MKASKKAIGVTVLLAVFALCLPAVNLNMGIGQPFRMQSLAFAVGEVPPVQEPFETEELSVADPLERLNRAFFQFNDKLYFWFLKPVSTAHGTVLPQGLRIAIRNAFHNVLMPVRVVNCALQGKGKAMGTELGRFVINSTLGVGGLIDFAYNEYGLSPHDEDTGQTFGVWGMKPVIYFNWPILGPSSLRDTLGLVGDYFLNPINYLALDIYASTGIKAGKEVNNTSLRLGEYEDFKKSALDPYVSLRDAFIQYRTEEIRK